MGGRCHKCNFCRDKSFVGTKVCLSRQKYAFSATNTCLSLQNTSFVAIKKIMILVAVPACITLRSREDSLRLHVISCRNLYCWAVGLQLRVCQFLALSAALSLSVFLSDVSLSSSREHLCCK